MLVLGCSDAKLHPFIPGEKTKHEIDVAVKRFMEQRGQTKLVENDVYIESFEETTQSSGDDGNEGSLILRSSMFLFLITVF